METVRTEVMGGVHLIYLMVVDLIVRNQVKIIGIIVTMNLVESSRLWHILLKEVAIKED